MRRLAAAVLLLPLLGLTLWAEDEKNDKDKDEPAKAKFKAPRATRDEGEATKAQQAFDQLAEEMEEKVGAAEKADRQKVIASYAKKFLAHAKDHPKDTSAVDALTAVLTFSRAGKAKDGPRDEAVKALAKDYVKSPAIAAHLRRLVHMGDDLFDVVTDVARDGADKRTRALAFRGLISARNRAVRMAEAIAKSAKMKAAYEKSLGKEKVALIVENAPKYEREVKTYRQVLSSGELKGTLPDVSEGAAAPETVAVDLKGGKVKLSDYRGKVVVLDFWATWCKPCREMIPHSRELVKEMKGRPFALIGVSVDDNSETVVKFQKKNEMPWAHWWVGRRGKQLETWDVEGYPTLVVIDHKGVIRHTYLGFSDKDKFSKEVEALVEEAEADRKVKSE
jgi:thiol-disulfide isomerase/thioredoxin